jgi:hypothetical protein
MKSVCFRALVLATAFSAMTPAAHAQFAVIDVAALAQLISQLQTLEQQVATARSQLSQAQQEYQSLTGGRGMQLLLAGTVRNYLPADWATLQAVAQNPNSGFTALAADIRGALNAQTVLSPVQLNALAPAVGAQLQTARQTAATLQGIGQEALANASSRFSALQQLIDAIGQAGDAKAALDLQARISAEVSMLQNEHTKLQVLYQVLQAQEWSNAQRLRELSVAGHGQFTDRFQPQP